MHYKILAITLRVHTLTPAADTCFFFGLAIVHFHVTPQYRNFSFTRAHLRLCLYCIALQLNKNALKLTATAPPNNV